MQVRDLPGWPPQWSSAYSGTDKFATGEDGTLKNVRWSNQTGLLNFAIEYEGRKHSGSLKLDLQRLVYKQQVPRMQNGYYQESTRPRRLGTM